GLSYRDEVLLCGFTDKLVPPVKLNQRHRQHELSLVVIHLPYTPKLDVPGALQVRTLLTGGSGFELASQGMYGYGWRPGMAESEARRYDLQANSYLELTCTASGTLASDRLLMHLQGWEPKNQNPIQDLSR